ncbi:MAG: hypothetical protein HQ515_07680 [Phycisphaeraceae bacterium]|nr:hypothetical protein [Phycisphaeraceae bacterium]
MLNTFKHRLDRIESEVGTENREDAEAGRQLMRAYIRWGFDQVDELHQRQNQGDEEATAELCRRRDETKGMSDEEAGLHFAEKVSGLLANGTLDPYFDSWDEAVE